MDITLNFHPASEPPKQAGEYMTIIAKNGYQYWRVLEWSAKHQMWNVSADDVSSKLDADYWAELPEVPNG